jgi:hypothetical protein
VTAKLDLISISLAEDDFGQSRVIRRDVDDFFISAPHSLLFTVSQFRILISALGHESRPLVFRRIAPTPIGIDLSLSGLIQVRSGQFLLTPYSESGARAHLSTNPALASELLHNKSPERLAHVLTRAINDNELQAGLDVLGRIPGVDVDSILALAIKDLKKSERETVFQSVGSLSQYFCRLAKATRDSSGEFISEASVCFSALLSLLDPLHEEEGYITAWQAALFCLSKAENDNDKLSALRFLAPIAAAASPVRPGLVSLSGVEISEKTAQLLKRRFDELTRGSLLDLLVSFKMQEFVEFAGVAALPLAEFLRAHPELAAKWPKEEIADRLRPLVAEGVFPDTLRHALEEAHWDTWTCALAAVDAD